jgi:hypothetical protein
VIARRKSVGVGTHAAARDTPAISTPHGLMTTHCGRERHRDRLGAAGRLSQLTPQRQLISTQSAPRLLPWQQAFDCRSLLTPQTPRDATAICCSLSCYARGTSACSRRRPRTTCPETLWSRSVLEIRQMEHTRGRGPKPARSQVERREAITVVEVDVDPFAARILGMRHSLTNELRSNAAALVVGAHLRVEQEGVVTSVPRNVDETDRGAVGRSSGNPAETVWPDLLPPAWRRITAIGCSERYQLLIGENAAPAVLDLRNHGSMVAEARHPRRSTLDLRA